MQIKSYVYLDKFESGTGLDNEKTAIYEVSKAYKFTFVFQPATWAEIFDQLLFSTTELNVLHFLLCILYTVPSLIYFGLSRMYKVRLMNKAKITTLQEKKEFLKVYFHYFWNFLRGTFIAIAPFLLILFGILAFFFNVELNTIFSPNSDESSANLTDLQK